MWYWVKRVINQCRNETAFSKIELTGVKNKDEMKYHVYSPSQVSQFHHKKTNLIQNLPGTKCSSNSWHWFGCESRNNTQGNTSDEFPILCRRSNIHWKRRTLRTCWVVFPICCGKRN